MDLTPIMQMAIDFVKALVPQKTGTKFLVAMGSLFAILYLAINGIEDNIYVYAVCGIAIIYFIADIICKKKESAQ